MQLVVIRIEKSSTENQILHIEVIVKLFKSLNYCVSFGWGSTGLIINIARNRKVSGGQAICSPGNIPHTSDPSQPKLDVRTAGQITSK